MRKTNAVAGASVAGNNCSSLWPTLRKQGKLLGKAPDYTVPPSATTELGTRSMSAGAF